MSGDAGSFLERWSRRKAAHRRGEPPPEEDRRYDEGRERHGPEERALDQEDAGARPPARAATGEADEASGLELPDIDSLDAGSDFSVFMRKGVPEELRRKALRKLWRVNPIIRRVDGLDDYCDDYTDAAVALKEGVRTLYQVGRGMVARVEETVARVEDLAPAEERAALPPAGDAPAPPSAGGAQAAGERTDASAGVRAEGFAPPPRPNEKPS